MPPLERWKEGFFFFVAIWAVVYLTLFAADRWAPVGSKGDLPAQCVLQFPKWFGCVLSNHENLAGGLIAAGGALFAAWWAATVIFAQMRIQEQEREKANQQKAEEDTENLQALIGYYDRLLTPFDSVEQHPSRLFYFNGFDDLVTSGDLVPFNRDGPRPLSDQALMMWQRLTEMRKIVDDLRARVAKTNMSNETMEQKISQQIERHIADIRSLRDVAFQRSTSAAFKAHS
jgi:hypothetical protein